VPTGEDLWINLEYFWKWQGKIFLMSHSNIIPFGDFVVMAEWVRLQLNNNRKIKFRKRY
jgi:hypothetical protein